MENDCFQLHGGLAFPILGINRKHVAAGIEFHV